LRGLAGGIMGGIIGGMLFRGLGFGSGLGDSGGGGIGFFEILLIAALLFGIYYFFKKRRQAAAAERYYQSSVETADFHAQSSPGPFESQQPEGEDLVKGLSYIRQMDSSFDEKRFLDSCMDQFFRIQGAWAVREMSGVKNLLTAEMFGIFCNDADKLKQEKKINKVENIAVRSVDVAEAWQESGRDYITVKFYANLLDYTVDESTGQVVSGSRTEPVKFEEYWTFTRATGNHSWQLSAITQPT
jgi:predicted lipid-binding transport protein (Tim44 family)